ncbi:glutamic acid-rich protein-like isoform X4 [Chrysemys picta bellii]|uniref:glutamic acid-rich protein-like isoform X4 n=1 Tax=Chrysemys picta bellii TaxID=8478 RepID=UPI0032B17850
MPTDAKKPELPLGAPAHVQKRRPIYSYFAKEAASVLNPVFHPEIEPKKQEDFMGALPVVKEKKDNMQKNLLPALEEADLKVEVGMEEESVYKDIAAERSSEDSDVENQPIDPESWKEGDIVTITKPGPYRITALVCDKWLTDAEPEEHDKEADMVPDGTTTGDDDDDDSESDTSSEDEEEKERWPLRRITVICTCCFCMKHNF